MKPEGLMEISPPEAGASHRLRREKKNQPRRGDGIDLRFSLSPCRGSIHVLGEGPVACATG